MNSHWEELMLKWKLQYFGYLMQRADSLEKTLMLGKMEGKRKKGMTEDETVGWHHRLNGITDSMDMSLSKLQEMLEEPGVLQSMGWQRVRYNLVTKQQQQQNIHSVDTENI